MNEKVKYIVRVALKNKCRLEFKTENGSENKAKILLKSFISQIDKDDYQSPPYLIGPDAIIMKSEIAYIGIETDGFSEEELED